MNKLKVIGLAAFVSLLSQPAISGQFVPREYQGIPGQYIIVLNDNMTMNSISARQATLHSMLATKQPPAKAGGFE